MLSQTPVEEKESFTVLHKILFYCHLTNCAVHCKGHFDLDDLVSCLYEAVFMCENPIINSQQSNKRPQSVTR